MESSEIKPAPSPVNPEARGQEILEEYRRPFWQNSKFWLGVVLLLVLAVFAAVYKRKVMDTAMSAADLKAAVEFFNISSQWKVTEKVDDPDFKGVVLAPEVSFRIRNVSRRNLSYVFLLGVFRFMDTGKTIGEGYRMALREPLPPGAASPPITLNPGFGYRATSMAAFEKNRENWRNSFCEVFAKSHNSGFVQLKTFYISRKIEGLDVEVEIQ
ncbi:MAG TPA: hypothetical protein PK919_04535 [Candidatus Aminicenantes bacterium]|nr:hypothetical protein [Candidatus Aminicenantes bacterium]